MNDLEKKARKKEANKKYYEKNKEKLKEYYKEWHQSEKGKKSNTINLWKFRGLIGDYDAIYDRYINSTHCELCNQPYKNSKDKCMDHCHITKEFRNICCNSCNTNMPKQDKEIAYDKYITKYGNSWRFRKTFKGKTYRKVKKSRIDLLCYKYIAFLQIRAQWRKLTN